MEKSENQNQQIQKKAKKAKLKGLLKNNAFLWRAGTFSQIKQAFISTGFADLDKILNTSGWPENALIELNQPNWGIGEMQLLAPALAEISQRGQQVLWVAPPFIPYAPALLEQGFALENVLIIPANQVGADSLWVMEKLLRARSCGVALLWPGRLNDKAVRRLQLAAVTGQSIGFVFRKGQVKSSPAALRVSLTPSQQGLMVQIIKARNGGRFQKVYLDLSASVIG